MKRKKRKSPEEIVQGEPIIRDVILHPSIINKPISEKTRVLVEAVAKKDWNLVYGNDLPVEVIQGTIQRTGITWTELMSYERMLYEIEELKRRHFDKKEFVIVAEENYFTSDFYKALEMHFMIKGNPAMCVLLNDGKSHLQILGDLIEEYVTAKSFPPIINN